MSKSLTILLVAPQPFYQDRGTPIAVRLLSENLAELGHRVHLLVYHEGEDISMEGVTIHRIGRLGWVSDIRPGMSWKKIICDLFVLKHMWSLRKTIDFDLIHAVEEAVFLAWLFNRLYGIPYVYDMDSSMSDQITGKFPPAAHFKGALESVEKGAVRKSMGVIAVCKALEDTVRRMAPGKEVLRLEDISLLDESADGHENLRETCAADGLIFLYVGNLESYQGIDLLLESFALARKEVSADLVVIGGVEQDRLKYGKRAAELNIEKSVHFVGTRKLDKLGYYLQQADILLSPRIKGSNTPMKIYSYLASGKPVLATRLFTHTQVLDDDVACLVEPEPLAMARGMIELVEDQELRVRLGESARELAAREYSMAAFKRKLSGFYSRIAESLS